MDICMIMEGTLHWAAQTSGHVISQTAYVTLLHKMEGIEGTDKVCIITCWMVFSRQPTCGEISIYGTNNNCMHANDPFP